MKKVVLILATWLLAAACERIDHSGETAIENSPALRLPEVAQLFSSINIGHGQMEEVHDAVSASVSNGYDEEYTLSSLFESPGRGVGEAESKASDKVYDSPLRDLISNYLHASASKADDSSADMTPERYMELLKESGAQIYWPYYENWNGEELPIITFDPGDGSTVSRGWKLVLREDGSREVETLMVDEDMAREHPVWVVNMNDDSVYSTVEILRREDPEWGHGGGSIRPSTKSEATGKALILKQFVMRRHYDCWLAGASEFFIKMGALEDFSASTEAELRLYSPTVTDFMVVVRRGQIDLPVDLDVVLVSNWSEQLESCAFMMTEDDGGSLTSWKCSGTVKIKSKSYGFDISIPLNTRDDIVWRGNLSASYIERFAGQLSHFGGVDLIMDFI